MAREYSNDINDMLRITDPHAGHMGAQFKKPPEFRPVQFEPDDVLPRDIRPYTGAGDETKQLGEEYFARRKQDMEMSSTRTRIGERTYSSLPKAWDSEGNVTHVSIPTESGWHADVTQHFVQPVYYEEDDKPRYAHEQKVAGQVGEHAITKLTGNKSWRQGTTSPHVPNQMAQSEVDRIIDSTAGHVGGTPHMRIGMTGKPWAILPETEPTRYPEVHKSALFLSEQGMHKAIDAIGTMPRPEDMGPPRRFKRPGTESA